jgi:hypothetical protein
VIYLSTCVCVIVYSSLLIVSSLFLNLSSKLVPIDPDTVFSKMMKWNFDVHVVVILYKNNDAWWFCFWVCDESWMQSTTSITIVIHVLCFTITCTFVQYIEWEFDFIQWKFQLDLYFFYCYVYSFACSQRCCWFVLSQDIFLLLISSTPSKNLPVPQSEYVWVFVGQGWKK